MHNPYDLHSWSKLHREEALREAQMRRLAEHAKEKRVQRCTCFRLGDVGTALSGALSLVRWKPVKAIGGCSGRLPQKEKSE